MSGKNMRRAVRRHHVARLKKNRQRYWGRVPEAIQAIGSTGQPWTPKALGAVSQYPCACSCAMCGNARKWFGERSPQERCALQEPLQSLLADD